MPQNPTPGGSFQFPPINTPGSIIELPEIENTLPPLANQLPQKTDQSLYQNDQTMAQFLNESLPEINKNDMI